jgi:hypothetical protein
MKIIPAIFTEKFEDCLKMLRQAESFTNYIQPKLSDFFTLHKGGGEAEKPFRAITFD